MAKGSKNNNAIKAILKVFNYRNLGDDRSGVKDAVYPNCIMKITSVQGKTTKQNCSHTFCTMMRQLSVKWCQRRSIVKPKLLLSGKAEQELDFSPMAALWSGRLPNVWQCVGVHVDQEDLLLQLLCFGDARRHLSTYDYSWTHSVPSFRTFSPVTSKHCWHATSVRTTLQRSLWGALECWMRPSLPWGYTRTFKPSNASHRSPTTR